MRDLAVASTQKALGASLNFLLREQQPITPSLFHSLTHLLPPFFSLPSILPLSLTPSLLPYLLPCLPASLPHTLASYLTRSLVQSLLVDPYRCSCSLFRQTPIIQYWPGKESTRYGSLMVTKGTVDKETHFIRQKLTLTDVEVTLTSTHLPGCAVNF